MASEGAWRYGGSGSPADRSVDLEEATLARRLGGFAPSIRSTAGFSRRRWVLSRRRGRRTRWSPRRVVSAADRLRRLGDRPGPVNL